MTDEELYKMLLQFKSWANRAAKDLDCEGMDILHDVYIKIAYWSKTNPLRSEVRGLVVTFLDRHIKDLHRAAVARRRRQESYHEDITMPQLEREIYEPGNYFSEDVTEAIKNLPWNYHSILVMRDICGMSYDEISNASGLPRGTISSRLYRARRLLAMALDKIREEEVN